MNEELKKAIAEQFEAFKSQINGFASKEETTKAIEAFKAEMVAKFEAQVKSEDLAKLEKAIEAQGSLLQSLQNKSTEQPANTIAEGILKFFAEKGIKSIADVAKYLKTPEGEMQFKANIETANYTGNVSRTQIVSEPRFAPLRPLSFIPFAKKGNVDNGKSIIMWVPSVYTANTGYAGEGTNTVTENAATAQEKSRKMAKISAKQYITAESFEDLPQFAQRLAMQLEENAMSWADAKVWSGDGDDSTNPLHIYGIKTNGVTAFDASVVEPVEKANEADLIAACLVQIKNSTYNANTVWMSPARLFALRRIKNTEGDYIVGQLIDGSPAIDGLRIVETMELTADEMIVGNAAAIQFWTKRNLTLKFGQFGSDVEADRYTAIIFMRAQVLVEDEDKKALIYVSDINAAKTAITIQNN